MYSKIYWITCEPQNAAGLMDHYDSVVAGAVRESAHHVGHQMIQVDAGKWLLVANYKSQQDAEDAIPMVQELVKPMIENFGMGLEVICQGETTRQIS